MECTGVTLDDLSLLTRLRKYEDQEDTMAIFTAKELEELARIDAEIDAEYRQTQEEIVESRKRDRAAVLDKLDNKGRKIAAQKAAYREANREKYNAYMREYLRKRRAKKPMNAMLKYPGAKWSIADWVIGYFPKHHSYLEPFFFGSGGVFF